MVVVPNLTLPVGPNPVPLIRRTVPPAAAALGFVLAPSLANGFRSSKKVSTGFGPTYLITGAVTVTEVVNGTFAPLGSIEIATVPALVVGIAVSYTHLTLPTKRIV